MSNRLPWWKNTASAILKPHQYCGDNPAKGKDGKPIVNPDYTAVKKWAKENDKPFNTDTAREWMMLDPTHKVRPDLRGIAHAFLEGDEPRRLVRAPKGYTAKAA